MKYQIIVSDIDGTLLNGRDELLEGTLSTINDAVASGVLFATASARTRPNTFHAIGGLKPLCCANAYVNGAYIETSENEVLEDLPMVDEEVDAIVNLCKDLNASLCCTSVDDAMANILHQECEKAFALVHKELEESTDISQRGFNTYAIIAYGKDLKPLIDLVKDDLNFTAAGNRSWLARFNKEYVYLQHRSANKGHALNTICRHFDIDTSKTIGIGDSMGNDEPLLDQASCAVAMKNAGKELQAMATHVTEKDHNEDGVGHFLRKLLF